MSASLFSFNSEGACEECKRNGIVKVDLSFLDDVIMTYPKCEGNRFKSEILNWMIRGKSIYEVLEKTIDVAADLFYDLSILNRL